MSSVDQITLDVGGHVFSTTTATLLRQPDSKFVEMLTKPDGKVFRTTADHSYFIDRDGQQFRHILNFLRDGTIPVLDNPQDRRELLCEARFYNVRDLARWCGTENVLETAMLNQQNMVMRQFAANFKNVSMQKFTEKIRCFDVVVECAMRVLLQHSESGEAPWCTIDLPTLFEIPQLAIYEKDVIGSGREAALLRCLCDSLQNLGFAAHSSMNGDSIEVDLWSPHDPTKSVAETQHSWRPTKRQRCDDPTSHACWKFASRTSTPSSQPAPAPAHIPSTTFLQSQAPQPTPAGVRQSPAATSASN